MHLVDKEIVREQKGHPLHVKRRHDNTRTPLDRLYDTDAILPAQDVYRTLAKNCDNSIQEVPIEASL
jgi:hypothetical protein